MSEQARQSVEEAIDDLEQRIEAFKTASKATVH
jgi:hypothetical protein